MLTWLLPPIVGVVVGGGLIVLLQKEGFSSPFERKEVALLKPTQQVTPTAAEATNQQAVAPEMVRRAEELKPQAKPQPVTPAPAPAKPAVEDPGAKAAPAQVASPQPPAPAKVARRESRRLQPWDWKPFHTPPASSPSVLGGLAVESAPPSAMPLMYQAVLNDDPVWIRELVRFGHDLNASNVDGDTPLCAAARLGLPRSIEALLTCGADAKKTGAEKQPAIALAALRRNTDVLAALLNGGADPNTRFPTPVSKAFLERVTIRDLKNALESDRGVTPLIACSARGDVEGASLLLQAGARTNFCTTRFHRYPINFAATQGYLFLMRILLGRQPDSEPEILVTVDLTRQRAWVTKEGVVVDSCSVSTGREGYATPSGRYVITDKHRAWTSTLYHVSMPFFMRLNCSAIGLHSGYVTGRPASHGCIRLPYEKAKKFFSLCRVGDEVQIVY